GKRQNRGGGGGSQWCPGLLSRGISSLARPCFWTPATTNFVSCGAVGCPGGGVLPQSAATHPNHWVEHVADLQEWFLELREQTLLRHRRAEPLGCHRAPGG